MSWFDVIFFKTYIRLHYQHAPTLYPWVYRIEKGLSYKEFLEFISKPPLPVTENITFLEGRSSFDYDAYLVKKWLIQTGSYRKAVQDKWLIHELMLTYDFLPKDLQSLEWFLYPDTYRIDANKPDIVRQIIGMQLDNFYNKVRWPDPWLFTGFTQQIHKDWFYFPFSIYSIIKLASVIENEEKNNQNKQTIAWLFLNRIDQWIQLGADVTLCYWKWITYDTCTPKFIVQYLYDKTNLYNTRIHPWLPPTPISNPSIQSIAAVLSYKKSDYIFYLHDARGVIHYGRTLEEHNKNKATYLP